MSTKKRPIFTIVRFLIWRLYFIYKARGLVSQTAYQQFQYSQQLKLKTPDPLKFHF